MYFITYLKNGFCKLFFEIARPILLFCVWILIHHIVSNLYAELCAPKTLFGLFITPFIVSSPHCSSMRWLINNSIMFIENGWILASIFVCEKIFFYFK
jgi:hypothetical protein